MAQILTDNGYTGAHALVGGFDAWNNGAYPVEKKITQAA